jgi:hypothetical protein
LDDCLELIWIWKSDKKVATKKKTTSKKK